MFPFFHSLITLVLKTSLVKGFVKRSGSYILSTLVLDGGAELTPFAIVNRSLNVVLSPLSPALASGEYRGPPVVASGTAFSTKKDSLT